MQIFSFINVKGELKLIEVEVRLLPGLPQIQFLGMPETYLKESAIRVKSALLSCGFKLPKAKQIIVNLRPSFIKKASQGLDLAIAVAILRATDQLSTSWEGQKVIIYGELSLDGKVIVPEDLKTSLLEPSQFCEYQKLTGMGSEWSLDHWQVGDLASMDSLSFVAGVNSVVDENLSMQEVPEALRDICVTESQAEILKLISLTQGHALLAGSPGAGKTFLADLIYFLRPRPNAQESSEIRKWNASSGSARPLFKPHHSSTKLGLIGGGSPLQAGVVTKAHHGILILDELLEFDPEVQESLREPMLEARVSLARAKEVVHYPAKFQCIATTNLCPCGRWTPNDVQSCRFSRRKCGSVLEKLSGPFLDRFDVLIFLQNSISREERTISFEILRKECLELRKFGSDFLVEEPQALLVKHRESLRAIFPDVSERRSLSVMRVARALALMKGQDFVDELSIRQAGKWAILPFLLIDRGM